jgi:thioredoxin reductase (NADPH)
VLDCLIIGGGPAGLTAAVYLARYRRTLRLIDSGGSRARLIPESHNYPGFKGVGGEELLQRLREQAAQYKVAVEGGAVEALERDPAGVFTASIGGSAVQAHAVILATGIVDKKPALDITGGDVREVIRYCPICDGYEAIDKKVAVLGGTDAAKKTAFLRTYTREVSWFSETPTVSGCTDADIPWAGQAIAITANPDSVIITGWDGNEQRFDLLYPALGCAARSDLATHLGATCSEVGTLRVDDHQQTTLAGLYAVGDVVSDLHQLAVASGHAALAATAIHNRLPRNIR